VGSSWQKVLSVSNARSKVVISWEGRRTVVRHMKGFYENRRYVRLNNFQENIVLLTIRKKSF